MVPTGESGESISRRLPWRDSPGTGAILRTIESNRFVTGVTSVDGELKAGLRSQASG